MNKVNQDVNVKHKYIAPCARVLDLHLSGILAGSNPRIYDEEVDEDKKPDDAPSIWGEQI